MRSRPLRSLFPFVLLTLGLLGSVLAGVGQVAAAVDTVDEVKYSYGAAPGEVVLSWRGAETTLEYGLDDTYGQQVTATPSAITPVDIAGPFMEARITGLAPGTEYHYRIGATGTDHTFRTAAGAGQSFQAIAIGDTLASTCRPYQSQTFALLAAQNADFVLHHGDISTANECGPGSVHRFFLDIEGSFSRSAAFMPVWGNHEYGKPTAKAPSGTVRDTLANYKGRVAIPNPQTVPGDTAKKTGNPGCGAEIGSRTNTCRGEDWGWFRAGGVVFIAVPEPWPNAISDWRVKAGAVLAQAQADESVDFVVTYGHRPLRSSTSYTPPAGWAAAFDALSGAYSPSPASPDGKYVLHLTGHRHTLEVFGEIGGTMHVVNGGGGQGLIKFGAPATGSTWRMKHLGFVTLGYDAPARELRLDVVCGPKAPYEVGSCTAGSTLYSATFTRPPGEPDPS